MKEISIKRSGSKMEKAAIFVAARLLLEGEKRVEEKRPSEKPKKEEKRVEEKRVEEKRVEEEHFGFTSFKVKKSKPKR